MPSNWHGIKLNYCLWKQENVSSILGRKRTTNTCATKTYEFIVEKFLYRKVNEKENIKFYHQNGWLNPS